MKKALVCMALVGAPLSQLVIALCGGNIIPCETMKKSSVVAVVDVIEVTPEPRPDPNVISTDSWYIVKFRVVERFKGLSPEQEEITGRFESSMEDPLEIWPGRWLLYAGKDKAGNWYTGCSHIKRANSTEGLEEVQQLRRCVKEMIVQ